MPFDNPEQKAEALGNSVKLNVHRWSDYPVVRNAVNAIYGELIKDPAFGGSKKLKKKHIKVLILDLYATWLKDETRYIAYSRSRNDYKRGSRYNCLHISFLTVAVVDALQRRGFVEHHIGFHNEVLGTGFRSRMRATDRLIELIRDDNVVPAEAIQHWRGEECIILRDIIDGRKTDVEYEDTGRTRRMRKTLTAYNDLLKNSKITLPNAPPEGIPNTTENRRVKPNSADKFVRRVFNNGSWKEGGRFYGGWWQRIPSDWRVQISIEGSKEGSVEIDYSGHHINLLYALEGIDYWKSDGDPYRIEKYEKSERMRSLLKLVLLITINARDRKTALAAIRQKIRSDLDSFGWIEEENIPLNELIEAFVIRHQPIAKHFFSGAGIRLQNLDSEIADTVINRFTQEGIPILCIHDSFVINPAHADNLELRMKEAVRWATRHLTHGELDITPKLTRKIIHNIIT